MQHHLVILGAVGLAVRGRAVLIALIGLVAGLLAAGCRQEPARRLPSARPERALRGFRRWCASPRHAHCPSTLPCHKPWTTGYSGWTTPGRWLAPSVHWTQSGHLEASSRCSCAAAPTAPKTDRRPETLPLRYETYARSSFTPHTHRANSQRHVLARIFLSLIRLHNLPPGPDSITDADFKRKVPVELLRVPLIPLPLGSSIERPELL